MMRKVLVLLVALCVCAAFAKDDKRCTHAKGCPGPIDEICEKCKPGTGPACAKGTCLDHKCHVIEPCSIKILPPREVEEREKGGKACNHASGCPTPDFCRAHCKDGAGPKCAKGTCLDHKCHVIEPCSQKVQKDPRGTTTGCEGCAVPDICRACPAGEGPQCAEASCVDGECHIIEPCSIKSVVDECNHHSACPSPQICAVCKAGHGPECARGTCVDHKCHVIDPCSLTVHQDTPREGTPPNDEVECSHDEGCFHPDICRLCPNGEGPECAQAACINHKCHIIEPCSVKADTAECDHDSACPSPQFCGVCKAGQGPECAKGTCINHICEVIEPCSLTVHQDAARTVGDHCTAGQVCAVSRICRKCPRDTGPACAKGTCLHHKCHIIEPCSVKSTTNE